MTRWPRLFAFIAVILLMVARQEWCFVCVDVARDSCSTGHEEDRQVLDADQCLGAVGNFGCAGEGAF